MQTLFEIAGKFKLPSEVKEIKPFGSGHINDTYKLSLVNSEAGDFILQRINHHVFPDINGLSGNFSRVTNHLKEKLNGTVHYRPLYHIPAHDNSGWIEGENGDFWRIINFIPGSKAIDLAENTTQVYEAGKAYGWFLRNLADLPKPELVPTIERFHDLQFRLDQLNDAIKQNKGNRKQEVENEIAFYKAREAELLTFYKLVGTVDIPYRATHNDTKINNVLFAKDDKVLCVIDLDTTMPGVVHYDFGDALRTLANTALEDEQDCTKVRFNLEYFENFAKGYLEETKSILTSAELNYLSKAPVLMTYIMGIRFLTDYLNGDIYYKTKYSSHNLVRSRVQMHLIKSMEEQMLQIEGIVKQLS